MAHYAELDGDVVTRIVVVGNNDLLDKNGVEDETLGIEFLESIMPGSGPWIRTSYNNNIRGTYAGLGFTYLADEDIFVEPQPYPSWVRQGSIWVAPIESIPGYDWDEDTLSWILPPKPYDTSIWNPNGHWESPIPYPGEIDADGHTVAPAYDWDENAEEWIERTE